MKGAAANNKKTGATSTPSPAKGGSHIPYFLAGTLFGIIIVVGAELLIVLYGPWHLLGGISTTTIAANRTTSPASTSLFTTTASTTSTSSSTTSTSSTSTTSIPPVLKQLPAPTPNSQIVRQGASANITDAGASGGVTPYNYQWLGAVINVTSNFTASYGNTLCLNTAQSATCNFQSVFGQNTLQKSLYYLKLRVVDSSAPSAQANNSTVASMHVV